MNTDLTVGEPRKVLFKFCLPLFGSVIFQQLYNIADSWVAGKFIHENALAAVGNSYEITLIFIAFAFGCNIGCSVITARCFGAKQYDQVKSAVSTSCISSGILCLTLMLLGFTCSDVVLSLLNTPKELYADSKLYLDIYLLGLPFVFFYNISTGVFSALGDSKTPFFLLAISSTVNIAMDILFVKTFRMGVDGLAWATFICQGISCIVTVILVFIRLKKIRITTKFKRFSKTLFVQFVKIAVPSILQQSFISVGNIILQGIINSFGPGVIAGYSAGIKLNNLVISSFTTFGNGISNYTSQNIGAEKHARIPQGFKAGLKIVWALAIPLILLYVLFPDFLIRLFLDTPSEDALKSGVALLRILAPFYLFVSTKLTTDGMLRGAGLMNYFMIATFTDLLIRVVLSFCLSGTPLESTGIWCAFPIGWVIATTLSVYFYRKHLLKSTEPLGHLFLRKLRRSKNTDLK